MRRTLGLRPSRLVRYAALYHRPHRTTTYVDAAYCYRRSSVVCLSVCLSVTIVSPAKTAELIEMRFWMCSRVGQRNH